MSSHTSAVIRIPTHAMPNHLRVAWPLLLICGLAFSMDAAPLRDGRLSQVVRDVRASQPNGPSLQVTNGRTMADGVVQTGRDSRAEITFSDQTVVRLGDNTEVSVRSDRRTFELVSGAVLTQVPSGVGGTTLKIGKITATTTGTTLTAEALPNAYIKVIML